MSVEGREVSACPFCGFPLRARVVGANPHALCVTKGCFGTRLPVVQLDDPASIAAWNRRATPPDQGSGQSPIARDEAAGSALRDALSDLVAALDGAFISSWQSTGAWQKQLDHARTLLAQASNASSLAKELQAKPAAGTPTTNEGEK